MHTVCSWLGTFKNDDSDEIENSSYCRDQEQDLDSVSNLDRDKNTDSDGDSVSDGYGHVWRDVDDSRDRYAKCIEVDHHVKYNSDDEDDNACDDVGDEENDEGDVDGVRKNLV